MHETTEELAALDEIISRSFVGAGAHLTSIISDERRLSALDVANYLTGIRHLIVATTTAKGEPRCSAVDGIFVHGHFWFSTSATSVKAQHLEARPALSAAHIVGDDIGIFVHGSARIVRGASSESERLNPYWIEVCGATPENWVDEPRDARYIEIIPASFFTYAFDRARFENLVRPADAESPESTET